MNPTFLDIFAEQLRRDIAAQTADLDPITEILVLVLIEKRLAAALDMVEAGHE